MKMKIKSQGSGGGSNNLNGNKTTINFGGKRSFGRGVEESRGLSRYDAAALFSPTSSRARALLSSLIFDLFLRKQLTRLAFEKHDFLTLELVHRIRI